MAAQWKQVVMGFVQTSVLLLDGMGFYLCSRRTWRGPFMEALLPCFVVRKVGKMSTRIQDGVSDPPQRAATDGQKEPDQPGDDRDVNNKKVRKRPRVANSSPSPSSSSETVPLVSPGGAV